MAITFGSASAPSQITKNFDALFAQSLANYADTMIDNISSSMALLFELKNAGMWQEEDGGTHLVEPLIYENAAFDSYAGYDEMQDSPIDGVTQAIFEWRMGASWITYSREEIRKNAQRLHNLVDTKLQQLENGFKEGMNRSLLAGKGYQTGLGADLKTPFTSAYNGSQFVEPIPSLIDYAPTSARSIGNIAQNTYSWWQNKKKASSATTMTALLLEFDELYDQCSRGPGGEPTLIMTDETTKRLLNAAYYLKYRTSLARDGNYPFDNLMFRNARVVWDENMPDVATPATTTATKGTAWFINPQFIKMKVDSQSNFSLEDPVKPPRGQYWLRYSLFMGQMTCNNRRKLGVLGNIARTLTAS
jgi:hypothetical protein